MLKISVSIIIPVLSMSGVEYGVTVYFLVEAFPGINGVSMFLLVEVFSSINRLSMFLLVKAFLGINGVRMEKPLH